MKKLFLLLALVGTIFSACEGGGDVEEENGGGTPFIPEIKISPTTLTYSCNGGEQMVNITANFEYEIAEQSSWITIEQTDKGLVVIVDANKNTTERSAFVSVSNSKYDINKSIEVRQEGFVPKIELSQQSIEVEFEPAEYSVDVTSPYSWKAVSDNDWIVVETKTGIAGTKTLKFSVARNEEEEIREGTITLKNTDYNLIAELYVIQKIFTPIIEYTQSLTFASEGGTQEVAITANVEYEIKSDADWLTIKKNENGISVTVPNYVEVDERTAEITISNEKYGVSKNVTVSQAGLSEEEYAKRIFYTTSDNKVITPSKTDAFGANIVSNTYENGKGIIKFDAPVTSIGEDAFRDCSSLTSITIPYSVTSLGEGAFSGCSSLTSIAIPDGVTSIGNAAFEYCSSLTSVTIPDSVTSIGNYAFEDCSSLTSVTIPDSVTSIGSWTFFGCSSLTSVKIGNSVTSIGDSAFYGCDNLKSVYISDLSAWCKIDFTNSDSNPLYNGAKLYLNNTEATDLIIPSDVTEIKQYAFYRCSSLTSVTIPNSVTSIGNSAFWNCDHLTSVTIPDSVTSIGEYAFYGCNSLTSVTIGNSVTSIGDASFAFCDSLTSVYISDLSAWCKIDFTNSDSNPLYNGAKLYLNNTEVTELTIPSDITKIKDAAFRGCSSLTSVTIPDSVTSIGSDAFEFCSSLTSVTIGNSVTSIGSDAFEFCSSLTSVTIGNSVTSIGSSAFYRCSSLTSLTIPDSVTSIGSSAFGFCSSLTSVTIPDSVTEIGQWAFNGCSALTSVKIGNGVTSIGKSAFYGCTGELIVNCNIPSVSSSSDDVFDGSKFTKVTIGNSVTSIGKEAFSYCSSLTSVTIGNGVTSIGHFAFEGCSSLTSVTIGNSVTSIGEYAFNGCRRLTSVYCKAVTPPTGGSQMFSYYHHDHGTYYPIGCKIYVPRSSVSAYKSYKYGWSSYYDYIVGYDF